MIRALLHLIAAGLALLLFVGGAVLLSIYFVSRNDPVFAQVVDFIQERGGTPIVLIAGATAMFFSLALHFWASINMGTGQHFHFNTDLGGVGISLSALEQFITKQAEALPMVKSVRPEVTTSADGKRLRLTLETQVIASGSLKNVTNAVQEAVVNAIRDGLGLTEIETVDVSVTKISTPKGGLPAATPALTGEPVEPPLLGNPHDSDGRNWPGDTEKAETGDADEAHHSVP